MEKKSLECMNNFTKTSNLKVLWLAPNFNHYKARFLNHLAQHANIELTILSGTGRTGAGDVSLKGNWAFEQVEIEVSKQQFGMSKHVRRFIKHHGANFDWILLPAEKKNLPLVMYVLLLKVFNKHIKIVSYNHPVLRSKKGRVTTVDKAITKFFYLVFDRIIFYTKKGHEWAIDHKMISPNKAFWANNTIDTLEIAKYYDFSLPNTDVISMLFIGRLIESKRLDVLFTYFEKLKTMLPDKQLELNIIGDGPLKSFVSTKIESNEDILWHGAIIDESKIEPIMKKASLVFIPGHSGLSVNHAFAYGRPYITIAGASHAPEVSYIKQDINGYVLNGSDSENLKLIASILTDSDKLIDLCNEAYKTGIELSVEHWVTQIANSLSHES